MDFSPLAHERQHLVAARARLVGQSNLVTQVHEGIYTVRHEAVIDQYVFLDPEAGVAALEIPGVVVLHPVAQRQVLRSRWRADGIRLHEAELVYGALEWQ